MISDFQDPRGHLLPYVRVALFSPSPHPYRFDNAVDPYMSIVDTQVQLPLSEAFRHYVSSQSDSDRTVGHYDRSEISWSADGALYRRTFAEDSSDEDNDTESITSSMMMDRVPPLTRGSSISSSDSAVQTDTASVLQGGYVLETDDGILTLPSTSEPDADLLCPFQILDCAETFSSVREFKVHVFSHFRGHPLPTSASCFLCEIKFSQEPEDDPALAWNKMLGHMAHDHFRQGQQLGTIRADFALMRWMYDRKIISDHYFKRTQIRPLPTVLPSATRRTSEVAPLPEAPTPPSPLSPAGSEPAVSSWTGGYQTQAYVTFAGRRAERRRRDSTRPFTRHVRTWT